MNFCSIAIIALVSSTSTTGASAFSNRNPDLRSSVFLSKPPVLSSSSSLSMIYPGSMKNGNVVAFTTTIHREEVNLESLSIPQLKQMQHELETINERCTEDGTQTNPECDVELKDERDYAILQIQRVLNERTGENSKLKYVDMDAVRTIVAKPWIYPLQTIRQQIKDMEILNCECTEDGNQTDPVCDVQLKDERDSAIEALTLYMNSVEDMLATEGVILAKKEERRKQKEQSRSDKICRDAHAEEQAEAAPALSFDMGEIRDCVDHPGSKSLVEMQAMLAQLEAVNNACTEEGTQTNPECDVEVKAERDDLMESLVSMIRDAKMCMDQIKAFAEQGDKLDEVAVEEVMDAVINTIPNLPNNKSAIKPGSTYEGPTDEYLVQI
mmetsp:Transcript_921/g.1949  ORF Transcript_921/g.1949 Transcript_921/m.1949 type:complete len:382 (+) Transcript_921:313-1458(+)|eukprot:CAMPEP_0197183010 /NCGR_PEP_ID=MMETSP1423-20130617/7247_1 /TAXON_ID=476441 /ORGANISM="Pseudo-nitzschia heimii, Strain UNC1101" /LENGTH=381 /DNA_ID=CAMNT_0042633533 /DNA_START=211 /DNA_END=1356 /DNA_ORIENTATION=+